MMTSLCQDFLYDDKGKIFFSTLSSICTVSDFIIRKVRGFLMVIWLDCTKLELIAEENVKFSPIKSKGKAGSCSHKEKGKTRNMKKLNPVEGGCVDLHDKSPKDIDFTLAHKEKKGLVESKKTPDVPQGKDMYSKKSLFKEPTKAVGVGKSQSAARKTRREKGKNRIGGLKNPVEVINCKRPAAESSSSSIPQNEAVESYPVSVHSTFQNISGENSSQNEVLALSSVTCSSANGPIEEDHTSQRIQEIKWSECYQLNKSVTKNKTKSSILETRNCNADEKDIPSSLPALDIKVLRSEDSSNEKSAFTCEIDVKTASLEKKARVFDIKENPVLIQEQESRKVSDTRPWPSSNGPPYEWPSMASTYFPPVNPHLPPATDRLYLDVGCNWLRHIRQSFLPAIHQRNIEGGCNPALSRRLPMSLDWPPRVRGASGLAPSLTCNHDFGFISRWHCTYPQGFSNHGVQLNVTITDEERKHSGDFTDMPELTSKHELADDWDNQCISEAEVDVHAVTGIDYNQYFGGGVTCWNPSDRPAGGFSRPPSLSSNDSLWAWREADVTRAVDDLVAFSSPYSTTGLTLPTASFCSPFDSLAPYVMTGNEVPGKVLHSPSTVADAVVEEVTSRLLTDFSGEGEGKTGDPLPYQNLSHFASHHHSKCVEG